MQWASVALHCFLDRLNALLDSKFRFEKHFVLGELPRCREILDEVEREAGVSLWTLHNRFLVEETEIGLQASAQFLSTLNDTRDVAPLLKFFAHFMKMRVENAISYENFQLKLGRELNKVSANENLRTYIQFKLNVGDAVDHGAQFPFILHLDCKSSLLDRYLSFQRIAQSLCEMGDTPSWLPETVAYALRGVTDPANTGIFLTLDQGDRGEPTPLSLRVIEILDSYTRGEYEDCAKRSSKLLLENPLVYELYELLVKSLLYTNQPALVPSTGSKPIDVILKGLDSIFRKENQHGQQLETIRKLAALLDHCALAGGLRQLYGHESGTWELSARRSARLDYLFMNPRLCFMAGNPNRADLILGTMRRAFPNSTTVAFVSSLVEANHSQTTPRCSDIISERRREFYIGRTLGAQGHFKEALPYFERLYARINPPSGEAYPLLDQLLPYLFDCYLQLGDSAKAADTLVSHYFRNPALIRHLNIAKLIDDIEARNDVALIRDINVPIAYALHYNEPKHIYVAYDNFLCANGVDTPQGLIRSGLPIERQRLAFFLRRVCAIEVLARSYHFQETEQVQKERIFICQKLLEMDADHSSDYAAELESLTQGMVIRRAVKRFEESKVHADVKGIRAAGDKIIRENFQRYLGYSPQGLAQIKMMDIRKLAVLSTDETGRVQKRGANREDLAANMPVVSLAHFVVFKEMFLDVRDRFIANTEYGLDFYLSFRIRHGALQGQVRNAFENLNLVSKLDSITGHYTRNAYWHSRARHLDESVQERIQTLLAGFAEEVDALIKTLRDSTLQIKTQSRPDGMFDFTFDDGFLFALYTDRFHGLVEFDVVLDQMFKVLWERTEEELAKIRRHIGADLKDKVFQRLTRLHDEIKNLVGPYQMADLLANIVKCRTSIQHEFEKLAGWFQVSTPEYPAHLTAKQLLYACITDINSIHSQSKIEAELSTEEGILFRGSALPHLSDIVCTLLDNVIKHSDVPASQYGVNISIRKLTQNLELTISNQISSGVRRMDPVGVLQKRQQDIMLVRRSHDSIRGEGGTGFAKIWKTLTVDLGRKTADIRFDYVSDNVFRVQLTMEMEGLTA